MLKEYERQEKKESTKSALNVIAGKFKGGQDNDRKRIGPRRNVDKYKEMGFNCGQVGYLKRGARNDTALRKLRLCSLLVKDDELTGVSSAVLRCP